MTGSSYLQHVADKGIEQSERSIDINSMKLSSHLKVTVDSMDWMIVFHGSAVAAVLEFCQI